MIARAGSGWQTVLADLSLILFMITASVVAQSGGSSAEVKPSANSEPLALWRDGKDAPPIADWLLDQSADARQQLTITVKYAPSGRDKALVRAAEMAKMAGRSARIVVEPGPPSVTASLAYDVPAGTLAQSLAQGLQYQANPQRP